MPNYQVICDDCEKEFEEFTSIDARNSINCSCGGNTTRTYKNGASPRPVVFREGVYEHIGPEPMYISSKRQLLDECKSHGVYNTFYG